jgi:hypothetical protein
MENKTKDEKVSRETLNVYRVDCNGDTEWLIAKGIKDLFTVIEELEGPGHIDKYMARGFTVAKMPDEKFINIDGMSATFGYWKNLCERGQLCHTEKMN